MKTSQKFLSSALIAVASLSAVGAFAADDGGLPVVKENISTKTRAEVKAEYLQALKDGTLPNYNDGMYPAFQPVVSAKNRVDARDESLAAARASKPALRD